MNKLSENANIIVKLVFIFNIIRRFPFALGLSYDQRTRLKFNFTNFPKLPAVEINKSHAWVRFTSSQTPLTQNLTRIFLFSKGSVTFCSRNRWILLKKWRWMYPPFRLIDHPSCFFITECCRIIFVTSEKSFPHHALERMSCCRLLRDHTNDATPRQQQIEY